MSNIINKEISLSTLSETNKEVLYNVLYDKNVQGYQPEIVHDTYKNQVEDDPERLLIEWMVFEAEFDDGVIDWFDEKYGNEEQETEVNKIIKKLYYLDHNQKQKVFNSLKAMGYD